MIDVDDLAHELVERQKSNGADVDADPPIAQNNMDSMLGIQCQCA
jgi:hypothetical protein